MTAIKKARYSSGDGLCILDMREVSFILDHIKAPFKALTASASSI